ncbi:MAG: diguanylate cyclase [Anaerolineales bacterium]|nr:diguanylate cyclase [Anaerolineales bacterium]
MNTAWIVFAVILFTNAVAAFAIAFILARRPKKAGLLPIIFMLIGLGIWSFSYAMITISPDFETKLFWLRVENVGIQYVPIFWFFFAMIYTRMDKWLTGKPVAFAFWIIPSISLLFIFSNTWFHLYYPSVHIATETGGPLIITRGPMYMIAVIFTYGLHLVSLVVLIRRFLQSKTVYRWQSPYFIGAVLFPFALNLIYQLAPGILPIFPAPVDLTPLSFTITAIILAAGIFGIHLLDIVPIARDNVMEYIPEMVFVLDDKERIVDANAVAQKWLGKPIHEIVGREPLEVFRSWPQLLQRFFFLEHSREEIEIPGDPPRILETIITPIYNRVDQLEGRVILAYDITDRKKLEQDLKLVNESLQEQLNENERLRLQLQEQAIRDPLTGVFNRRYFAEALDNQTARAIREGVPFSLIILDVDHFKKVNDTYGHKCGDIILQSLARFLMQNTRRSDIVCRFGGEEFVILMPDATTESAYERAELFRKQFEATVNEYEGERVHATFSAGVASFPAHAESGEVLLGLADQALYRSKAGGRNRVTIYSGEMASPNSPS